MKTRMSRIKSDSAIFILRIQTRFCTVPLSSLARCNEPNLRKVFQGHSKNESSTTENWKGRIWDLLRLKHRPSSQTWMEEKESENNHRARTSNEYTSSCSSLPIFVFGEHGFLKIGYMIPICQKFVPDLFRYDEDGFPTLGESPVKTNNIHKIVEWSKNAVVVIWPHWKGLLDVLNIAGNLPYEKTNFSSNLKGRESFEKEANMNHLLLLIEKLSKFLFVIFALE